MISEDNYNPGTETIVRWGLGIYNPDGVLVKVVTRRERIADPLVPLHTEETARHDRELWINDGFRNAPDRVRVVSSTVTPWSPT